MKQRKIIYFCTCLLAISSVWLGCNKQNDFLEVKGNNNDVVPSTLKDYQAILDNDGYMNDGYLSLGIIGSDNVYSTSGTWALGLATERNAYTWQPDIYEGAVFNEWNFPYKMMINANTVLEGLANITQTAANLTDWNNAKGGALFYRAMATYNLLQEFAKPFVSATAGQDPGVPLKQSSDIHAGTKRASVSECYNQVIADLNDALPLLPASVVTKTRPSRLAVFGMLAKTALTMGDYAKASLYADSALRYNNTLLDFNSLNPAASFPFPTFTAGNPEIGFYATANLYIITLLGYVDTSLYQSYGTNDLRKALFFKTTGSNQGFKGSYASGNSPFAGIATNEIYLIRAEAAARQGNTSAAMADLNTLLIKRWKTGTYTPLTATTAVEALQKILPERRKELPFTGNTRWEDLRRLNLEPAFAKTLTHIINGQVYTLAPNDNKYVLPIPDLEIRYSGIQQNPR
jgi:tetratricopeptide (TPR) repeat protein